MRTPPVVVVVLFLGPPNPSIVAPQQPIYCGAHTPGICWSLVLARGLTVAEEGGYRTPLPLPPTNTSIPPSGCHWSSVFLRFFSPHHHYWSTLPLPSSLRSIWVYGRVGLSPDRGSFRGDQIGTYRDAGGGSIEPTGRYIDTRPILQL